MRTTFTVLLFLFGMDLMAQTFVPDTITIRSLLSPITEVTTGNKFAAFKTEPYRSIVQPTKWELGLARQVPIPYASASGDILLGAAVVRDSLKGSWKPVNFKVQLGKTVTTQLNWYFQH